MRKCNNTNRDSICSNISTIKLTINGESVVDEKEVAEAFNEYFIKKIDDLKDGIDQNLKKYPLEKLAEKMRDNRNKFSLKKSPKINYPK